MRTKKQERLRRYEQHCLNLAKLANEKVLLNGFEIYRRLHRSEAFAHSWMEKACSDRDYDMTEEQEQAKANRLLLRVHSILNDKDHKIPIIFNWDPRGYALKIDPHWTRVYAPRLTTDLGGYGILAPEF